MDAGGRWFLLSLFTKKNCLPERNNELGKLRTRCRADNQTLAHVREKEFMLDTEICKERDELSWMKTESNDVRNYANRIKGERDQLRKKLGNMSKSCGLLGKTSLLTHYDTLTKTIDEQKQSVQKLKETVERLESKTESVLKQLH